MSDKATKAVPVHHANRQQLQVEIDRYREAAKRLHGGLDRTVSTTAYVHVMRDGAFVEIVAWVPRAEMEADVNQPTLAKGGTDAPS